MNEIESLVNISKYAGSRFDLVQAGGGNSSVKLDDGTMLIKASGFALSELEVDKGYSKVITQKIADIVTDEAIQNTPDKRERESMTAALVKEGTLDKNNRPSIETLLHSLLAKYTLHTHPLVVNKIVSSVEWKERLSEIFSEDEIVTVAYQTPGIELALELSKAISNLHKSPKLIFLQNHGLIVSSDDEKEIALLTDYVVEKIENYLACDMSAYRNSTKLVSLFNDLGEYGMVAYLSRDVDVINAFKKDQSLLTQTPFCPDTLVYCGVRAVFLETFSDLEAVQKYKTIYYEYPKVISVGENIYLMAKSVKKAKDMEELLKFHLMVLEDRSDEVNLLEMEELSYLSNWEAEKFRQNI